MNKNTQILFFIGFILLCLYLSCKNKEGFVVIEESLFDEQCSELGECDVFLSGQQGAECEDAVDKQLYTIPPIGTGPDGLTRSKFTGQNFNMTPTGCAAGAYENDAPLSSQECETEGEPYTLTGCSPYCTDSDPDSRQGYIITGTPDYLRPGVARPTGDEITCALGYTPAINTCFYKKGVGAGEIANLSQAACTGNPLGTTEWFGTDGNIKIYCETGGENYILMGCEPECSSRINNVGDYLIVSDSVSEGDYVANKERIETMDGRTMDGGALSEAQVMQNFPYTENAEAILAPNDTFDVNLTPSGDWTFHTDEPTTSQCNILDPDENIKNKYYVNGLYPNCDSSREECLNFNIEYSPGQPAPVDLVGLRETLPTADIFQEGQTSPSEGDIQKYQNSLYYFRRFKNSDGNDEIEAQIRCDTAQTSDFHCSFIPTPPAYTFHLSEAGQTCNDVCLDEERVCRYLPILNSGTDLINRITMAEPGTICGSAEIQEDNIVPYYDRDQNICYWSGQVTDTHFGGQAAGRACEEQTIEGLPHLCMCNIDLNAHVEQIGPAVVLPPPGTVDMFAGDDDTSAADEFRAGIGNLFGDSAAIPITPPGVRSRTPTPPTDDTTVDPPAPTGAGVIGADDYTWVLGTLGENCTDTCTGADLTCSGEDTGDLVPWGVNDEDSFRVAMTAATAATGGSFEGTCTWYGGGSAYGWAPGVTHSGTCQGQWPPENPSRCSSHNAMFQRLCRCQAE